MLRELPDHWPLARPDRVQVAEYLAVQMSRTPDSLRRHGRLVAKAVHGTPHEADAGLDSLRMRAMYAIKDHTMTLLTAMQWTLVEFKAAQLSTSDHPVAIFPLNQAELSNDLGALTDNVGEVWFPVSSRRLLVLAWRDQGGHSRREAWDAARRRSRQLCNPQPGRGRLVLASVARASSAPLERPAALDRRADVCRIRAETDPCESAQSFRAPSPHRSDAGRLPTADRLPSPDEPGRSPPLTPAPGSFMAQRRSRARNIVLDLVAPTARMPGATTADPFPFMRAGCSASPLSCERAQAV